jgi:hypothetical protein
MTDGRCKFGPRAKREMVARLLGRLRGIWVGRLVRRNAPTHRSGVGLSRTYRCRARSRRWRRARATTWRAWRPPARCSRNAAWSFSSTARSRATRPGTRRVDRRRVHTALVKAQAGKELTTDTAIQLDDRRHQTWQTRSPADDPGLEGPSPTRPKPLPPTAGESRGSARDSADPAISSDSRLWQSTMTACELRPRAERQGGLVGVSAP